MLEHMPHLAFVPVEKLLIHEWHDDQRTPPLIERILATRVFRNPPIVSPLNDGSGRYMVLDGANRTTALQKMGYPHALVQVVYPDDPGLKLLNWNHVVWGLAPQAFLEGGGRHLDEQARHARRNVYEVYAIQEVDAGPVAAAGGKLFFRVGYQYYDFDYTGSGNWVGQSFKIADLSANDVTKTQLFAPLKHAWDLYFSFDVRF